MTVEAQHPDEAELEAERTGEADAELSAHVSQCPTCQARRELSQQLCRALQATPQVAVPERVDRAITALARGRLQRRERQRRVLRWVAPLAAAAAVLFAVVVPRFGGAPAQPQDINADGVVDILDALVMARAIEGGVTEPAWDFDANARVDAADVDRVALAAVTCSGGTP